MTDKSKKFNLYIDTTEYGKVTFKLEKTAFSKRRPSSKSFQVKPQESDKILIFLQEFLQKNKIQNPKSKFQKIIVYKKAEGSFTGLRIAAAIAQALSLAWGVPVKVVSK